MLKQTLYLHKIREIYKKDSHDTKTYTNDGQIARYTEDPETTSINVSVRLGLFKLV